MLNCQNFPLLQSYQYYDKISERHIKLYIHKDWRDFPYGLRMLLFILINAAPFLLRPKYFHQVASDHIVTGNSWPCIYTIVYAFCSQIPVAQWERNRRHLFKSETWFNWVCCACCSTSLQIVSVWLDCLSNCWINTGSNAKKDRIIGYDVYWLFTRSLFTRACCWLLQCLVHT